MFTDVLQTLILFGGSITAVVLIAGQLGGIRAIIPINGRPHWAGWVFFDTTARVSFLTAVIAVFGWHVCTAGSDQMAIQRYLATAISCCEKNVFKLPGFKCRNLSAAGASGIGHFGFYQSIQLVAIEKTMLRMQTFVSPLYGRGLPVGVSGLVLAGCCRRHVEPFFRINSSVWWLCAILSRQCKKTPGSDIQQVKLARIISIAIGVLVVVISWLSQVKGNSWR